MANKSERQCKTANRSAPRTCNEMDYIIVLASYGHVIDVLSIFLVLPHSVPIMATALLHFSMIDPVVLSSTRKLCTNFEVCNFFQVERAQLILQASTPAHFIRTFLDLITFFLYHHRLKLLLTKCRLLT